MTLSLARQLSAAGHQVYVADSEKTNFCSYSRCVKEALTTPPMNRDPSRYISEIVEAVSRLDIDLIIPSWEEVLYLARFRDRFPQRCTVFAPEYDLLHQLHHKGLFMGTLERLGFAVPQYKILESAADAAAIAVERVALKACYSRSSSQVYCMHAGEPFPKINATKEQPWIAQEWIVGKMYCSYSICQAGRLAAHTLYPMELVRRIHRHSQESAGSYCLSYVACENEHIENWIRRFAQLTGFTGQIAFDFVERASDGQLFAIDCNPRMTHGVTLFGPQDNIGRAFLGWSGETLRPPVGAQRQLLLANLCMGWRLALRAGKFGLYLRRLLNCPDIVFAAKDPGPALFQAMAAFKLLGRCLRMGVSVASAFTFDADYNGDSRSHANEPSQSF